MSVERLGIGGRGSGVGGPGLGLGFRFQGPRRTRSNTRKVTGTIFQVLTLAKINLTTMTASQVHQARNQVTVTTTVGSRRGWFMIISLVKSLHPAYAG